MKAIAKMFRIYPNGTKTPIEGLPGQPPKGELDVNEKIVVELWHGNCLEAEVEVSMRDVTKDFEISKTFIPLVRLIEKKQNRKDFPEGAVC